VWSEHLLVTYVPAAAAQEGAGGMESGGAQAVHAEVPVVEPGPAGPGGVEALAVDGSFSAIELIEEYGLLALVLGAVLVWLFRRTRTAVENASFEASVRRREDSMRKVREMQQARYEIDTAEQRAKLAELAEKQRQEKLEEMEAMAEGYAHEHPRASMRAIAVALAVALARACTLTHRARTRAKAPRREGARLCSHARKRLALHPWAGGAWLASDVSAPTVLRLAHASATNRHVCPRAAQNLCGRA
jgi:hypothetical protein